MAGKERAAAVRVLAVMVQAAAAVTAQAGLVVVETGWAVAGMEVVAEAAEHFGIADEDGSRPVSIRSLGFALSYALGLDRASGGWGAWLMAALRYVKIPFGVFRNAKYAMERKQRMQSQVVGTSASSDNPSA